MNKLTFATHKKQLANIYTLAIKQLSYRSGGSPEDDPTCSHLYACHAIRDAVNVFYPPSLDSTYSIAQRNALVDLAINTFAEYFKPVSVKKDDGWFGDTYAGCVENYRRRLLALMFMVEICK